MRRFFQFLLRKPVLWAANRFSSKPDRTRIFESLSRLKNKILTEPHFKQGIKLKFDPSVDRFIIFSDHHKGAGDWADDFRNCEPNYLQALEYYNRENYTLINLGDAEELWENTLTQVRKQNEKNFAAEKMFINREAFYKVFGNHDLYWGNDPFASWVIRKIYGKEFPVYEGILLESSKGNQISHILLTHGHQGDRSSDGNWFSKIFVARVWAPLQAYLQINPNTPAYDEQIKTEHNRIMYEWSAQQKNTRLITGHTHQPVFESLTHLERLHRELFYAESDKNTERINQIKAEILKRQKEYRALSVDFMTMVPTYYNSGCCCFSDGDITGIEHADNEIRLVKWTEGRREELEANFVNREFRES